MTRKSKIVKKIFSVLWWAVVIALALLLLNVLGAKFKGRVPNVLGFSVMQIVSGSMEPTIETGSFILVRKIAPEDVKKGDIISFYSDESAIKGLPNTHKVVDKRITEKGIEFVTRGDANPKNDTVTAKGDKLIGVYVTELEFLNEFNSFLNGGGMFWILMPLWIMIFAMIGVTMYKKLKDSESPEKRSDSEEM